MQVVVVEKGHYICARDLTLLERDAFGGMYEGSGLMTTDDAGRLSKLRGPAPFCWRIKHLLTQSQSRPSECDEVMIADKQASIS